MTGERALIVGAGIGGLVAATALRQAGFEVTVYEAYPTRADDAGAWLSVAVNGLDALAAVGLREAVMAVGVPSRTLTFVSGTGKPLGSMPLGGTLADGTVTHTMTRAALYRALYDAAVRRGVHVAHGARLADADVVGGGVRARFTDGTTAAGDVLIGADGLHSRTRRLLDAAAPAPRYTGVGGVGGVVRGVGVDQPIGDVTMMFGRRAFFAYTRMASDEVWWFANPPSARERSPEELAAFATPAGRASLARVFAGDDGPATELIAATADGLVAANQYDLPAVPTWSRGPMLIIGDAAHATAPSSGQGASMAIEDAVLLALCLRDGPDVPTAFATYEQRRRPRVTRVVAQGAGAAKSKAAGPIARVLRDLLLPRMLARYARAGVGALAWQYDYHIDWEAPALDTA